MDKFYRVVARGWIDGDVVTTNDKEYAQQLVDAGGKILCHPDLFVMFPQHQTNLSPHIASPYVIHIMPGQFEHLQNVPKDVGEGYEVRTY